MNVRCPHPGRCGGARSHRAGSAAASACARAVGQAGPARASAPPAPGRQEAATGANLQQAHRAIWARENQAVAHLPQRANARSRGELESALLQALAAGDPPGWTPGCGQPHPTGGYTTRTLWVSQGTAEVEHRDASGARHNEAGPAYLVLDADSGLRQASWHIHGQRHRTDGPAQMIAASKLNPGTVRFVVEGKAVHGVRDLSEEQEASARYADLLEGGAAPGEAIAWMAVGHRAGDHEVALGLRGDGADASLCLQAVNAGVTGAATLAEVGHGRLPLSWALAGAQGA